MMAHFFVFSADESKTSVTDWEKYLSASERSYLALSIQLFINEMSKMGHF